MEHGTKRGNSQRGALQATRLRADGVYIGSAVYAEFPEKASHGDARGSSVSEALREMPEAEGLPGMGDVGVTSQGHYMPAPVDGNGKTWVRASVLVQAESEDLYSLWRDCESAPIWQEQIIAVRSIGPGKSHWTMAMGKDKTVEWDSEILADEPGKRIAWRSTGGDSQNAGEVVFTPAVGGRGTVVTLLQEFGMGKLALAWETIVGRNPKQTAIENLRHFKALAETGEIPRTTGQSHGPRGLSGKAKASMYRENIPSPAR